MAHLKQKLMQEGVPPDAEAKMVAKSGLRGDSPGEECTKETSGSRKAQSLLKTEAPFS